MPKFRNSSSGCFRVAQCCHCDWTSPPLRESYSGEPSVIESPKVETTTLETTTVAAKRSESGKLAPQHRGRGAESRPRLVEAGLARRQALQSEARQQERAQGTARLHGAPQLHRRGERDGGDRDRRPELRRQRPKLVREERHGQCERGEVRAAALRESRRARIAAPRGDEGASFDSGNRTMLGTMEPQRRAPQQPDGDPEGRCQAERRPVRLRNEDEEEGCEQRGEQQRPLAATRYALTPEEGSEGRPQPKQPADERHALR